MAFIPTGSRLELVHFGPQSKDVAAVLLQKATVSSRLICHKGRCTTLIDQYCDPAQCFFYETTRTWRNGSKTRLFAADHSRATRHPVLEPLQPDYAVRQDMKALRQSWGKNYQDLTVVHPLTPACLPFPARRPLKSLNYAFLGKYTRFVH